MYVEVNGRLLHLLGQAIPPRGESRHRREATARDQDRQFCSIVKPDLASVGGVRACSSANVPAARVGEVKEMLGRARHERRGAVQSGYRNDYGQPRQLALLNGTVTVRRPRMRNLDERFVRRVLPPFQRRTPQVAKLLPERYLYGLSSGDFILTWRGLLGDGTPLRASSGTA